LFKFFNEQKKITNSILKKKIEFTGKKKFKTKEITPKKNNDTIKL
jgi:hypothetical protein